MPLIIGGAADGEWVNTHERDFQLARPKEAGAVTPRRAYERLLSPSTEMLITTYRRYEFRLRLSSGQDAVQFFYVDVDEIKNDLDLLNALARGYRPVRHTVE